MFDKNLICHLKIYSGNHEKWKEVSLLCCLCWRCIIDYQQLQQLSLLKIAAHKNFHMKNMYNSPLSLNQQKETELWVRVHSTAVSAGAEITNNWYSALNVYSLQN